MKQVLLVCMVLLMAPALMANMSIGERFHHETAFGDSGVKGENPKAGDSFPLYKTYESSSSIALPLEKYDGLTVEQAIQKRRSVRHYSDKALLLPHLTRVCLSACGLTHMLGAMDITLRAAPSGGALYPIELYVIAHDIDSLADGLYHFQVKDSTLELIREGDLSRDINDAAFNQSWVGASPATLVLTARFARSTRKYFDRGYRYTYMEAGAICENIYLQATSLGLGTVSVGAFNDDALNELLGVDGINEAALLIMPIGYPAR